MAVIGRTVALDTARAGLVADGGLLVPAVLPRFAPSAVDSKSMSPEKVAGPQGFYWPELDVLRLVAFCMVWCAHASLSLLGVVPQGVLRLAQGIGSCGVPVFFFLSAFLITERMRRERGGTGCVNLRAFYVRRALRIWPLYFGVLVLYAALGLFFHGFRIEPGRLIASCLLVGNWYLVAHPLLTSPMRSLWSVSVEEQWYLLWPLLFARLTRRRSLIACAAFVVVSMVTLSMLAMGPRSSMLSVTAWDNSLVQFQFFAFGAATALLLNGRVPRLGLSARLMLVLGAFCCLALAAGPFAIKDAKALHSPVGLVCGYLLAGVGAGSLFLAAPGFKSVGLLSPAIYLGRISFGLYVFHETGFFVADAMRRALVQGSHGKYAVLILCVEKAVGLGIAIVLASLSYRYWETPFLRLKRRWTRVREVAG
jgi:peptidoglycan/LPS O-acetylase OafA/YrhL